MVMHYRIVDYFYIFLTWLFQYTFVSTCIGWSMNHISCLRNYRCPPSATPLYICLVICDRVEMDVQLSVFFKFISIDESFIFAVYFQTFQNLDDYVINYYKSSFYGYFQTF
jgi:hypothetical protein